MPVVDFGQCRHGFLQMDEYVVHYNENCGTVFGARWKQVYKCHHLELGGSPNSHYEVPGYTAFGNQLLWLSRNLQGRNFVAQPSTSSIKWAYSLPNTLRCGSSWFLLRTRCYSMKICFVPPGLHRTTSLLFLRNCRWCFVRPVEFLEQSDQLCHNGRTDCRAYGL